MLLTLNWWRDLSVAKKLYSVVGLMGLLIAFELLVISLAINTLTAIRAFSFGESLWSKAQKDAVLSIYRYAVSGNPADFEHFRKNLRVIEGDHKARLALEADPPDYELARAGFIEGGNPPEDVGKVLVMLSRFSGSSTVAQALELWAKGDALVTELTGVAHEIEETVRRHGPAAHSVEAKKVRLADINARLTSVENEFTTLVSSASREIEALVLFLLTIIVLTVESTGLIITYRFSRRLTLALRDLTVTTNALARGSYNTRAVVHSRDELGPLAESINALGDDLQKTIGERQIAQRANEAKSTFVATTSHEIRNPLGIILGYVDLLKDSNLPSSERRRYLEVIENNGKNLVRIIDDLLDISRIEAGRLSVQVSPFSLKSLVEELSENLKIEASKNGNSLAFNLQASVTPQVQTDRGRLRQILVNLIGNSCKFTEHGEIEVQIEQADDMLHFRVRDTGMGICPDRIPDLFRAFEQGNSETRRQFGGSGLGLMLSKRLARALGGDLSLESSAVGEGSVFLLRVACDLSRSQASNF